MSSRHQHPSLHNFPTLHQPRLPSLALHTFPDRVSGTRPATWESAPHLLSQNFPFTLPIATPTLRSLRLVHRSQVQPPPSFPSTTSARRHSSRFRHRSSRQTAEAPSSPLSLVLITRTASLRIRSPPPPT